MADVELLSEVARTPRDRACDLCFAKKIKCDRNEPCAHCVAAGAACVRKRPKRRIRHTALPDFAKADESGTQQSGQRKKIRNHEVDLSPEGRDSTTNNVSQRRPSQGSASQNVSRRLQDPTSPTSEPQNDASSRHRVHLPQRNAATTQAQTHLQSELMSGKEMEHGRREVLEAALAFANRIASQPSSLGSAHHDHDLDFWSDESTYPSAEMLYFILKLPRDNVGLAFTLDMSAVISPSSIERQGFALIENRVADDVRLHYIININFIAWVYLKVTMDNSSSTLQRHLLEKQKLYERNLHAALHRVGILDAMGLSLLQALLSGAMFMLLTGNLEKCWHLSAAVSRVCAAMGGHYLATLASAADTDESSQVRYNLSLCYMFDKALALSMNRISCLPDMDLNAEQLAPIDPNRPQTAIYNVYLELSQVQDQLTRDARARGDARPMLERVQAAQQKMWNTRDRITQLRSNTSAEEENYLRGEWIGVDFAYYCVMTSILKKHPYLQDDSGLKDQLLGYARQAMMSLRSMLSHAKSMPELHTFSISICWLVLFYPLCPYFVLFCHIIETSSTSDFSLLEEVTKSLQTSGFNKAALSGVQRLFDAFLSLCRPHSGDNSEPQVDAERSVIHTGEGSALLEMVPQQHGSTDESLSQSWGNTLSSLDEDESGTLWSDMNATTMAGPWIDFQSMGDRDLMAELQSTQPSVGWYNGFNYTG